MHGIFTPDKILSRPIVYDYREPVDFLIDLLAYYKFSESFSLRQRTAKVGSCSQALVSQILNKKRQLNRENWLGIALVFKLTSTETHFIDQKLSLNTNKRREDHSAPPKRIRRAQNHLLSDWLNPYVKDLVNLKGFSTDAENLFSMLKGVAPAKKIQKSVDFLLREAYWRRLPSGEISADEDAATTTNEIPTEKIRSFHKRALDIASRGISELPMSKRKSSTVLVSVDQDKVQDLRNLIDSFQNQLLAFIEENPDGKDSLMQITMHLTPVGEKPHA
jgi:uncharacterized protein (TIGR02147 family)